MKQLFLSPQESEFTSISFDNSVGEVKSYKLES